MTIKFMSRPRFKRYCEQDDTHHVACISISDTSDELQQTAEWAGNRPYCGLVFHDVDVGYDGAFTIRQAERLVAFIQANRSRHFAIHCLIGISRSAAVAKFINAYLGRNYLSIRLWPHHNEHVFNTLWEAARQSPLLPIGKNAPTMEETTP